MSDNDIMMKLLTMIGPLGPLAGVLLGALITYYASRSVQREKWRQDRREKLAEIERDALAQALEWIEPMRNAHIRATGVCSGMIRGEGDPLTTWPDLLEDLTSMDMPARLRAVLPKGVYARGLDMIRSFEELKPIPGEGIGQLMTGLEQLNREINQLEDDLRKYFRETFE